MSGSSVRSIIATLVALALVSSATPARAWVTDGIQGTSTSADFLDAALDVAVDGAGDVVAAGITNAGVCAVTSAPCESVVECNLADGNDVCDFSHRQLTACKFSASDGSTVWCTDIGTSLGVSSGQALVIDSATSDVLVAGQIDSEFGVVRLGSATGTESWRATIAGSPGSALSLAVDGSGDVVAGGYVTGSDRDLTVCKFDFGTGALSWASCFQIANTGDDQANAVAVDPSGDVLVAGTTVNPINTDLFTVLKLAGGTGAQIWKQDGALGQSQHLAVDAAGQPAASGVIGSLVTVIKFDAAGTLLWQTTRGAGTPAGLVADASGDLLLAHGFGSFVTEKLDGTNGGVLWSKTLTLSGTPQPNAIGVDGGGDVLTAGKRTVATNPALLVVKRDGTTGAEIWRAVDAGGADEAFAVAVDGTDQVVLAATTVDLDAAGQDFVALKLSVTSGGSFPCGNGSPDPGEECDDGNAAACDGCTQQCESEICGNNRIDCFPARGVLEQCDDGGTANEDGCSDVCLNEFCGDGTIQTGLGEVCDDGNMVTGDGCSSACQPEFCGDGTIQAGLGEQCDDGGTANEDGCSALCLNEFCGDGTLQAALGEVCDDGNNAECDDCSADCLRTGEFCGNNIVETILCGETCDPPGPGCCAPPGAGCKFCRQDLDGQKCQKAIARPGRGFVNRMYGELRKCMLKSQPINFDLCVAKSTTQSLLKKRGGKFRHEIARFCTDPILAALDACGATVEALIQESDPTQGCLIDTHLDGIQTILEAQFGP